VSESAVSEGGKERLRLIGKFDSILCLEFVKGIMDLRRQQSRTHLEEPLCES